jgi:hypothetical protein
MPQKFRGELFSLTRFAREREILSAAKDSYTSPQLGCRVPRTAIGYAKSPFGTDGAECLQYRLATNDTLKRTGAAFD